MKTQGIAEQLQLFRENTFSITTGRFRLCDTTDVGAHENSAMARERAQNEISLRQMQRSATTRRQYNAVEPSSLPF